MRTEVHISIVLPSGFVIDPEVIGLLNAIRETGSITAASKAIAISYKKAWHMVDKLNAAFKEPIVSKVKGGEQRGGAHLTSSGAGIMTSYRSILTAAESRAQDLEILDVLAS